MEYLRYWWNQETWDRRGHCLRRSLPLPLPRRPLRQLRLWDCDDGCFGFYGSYMLWTCLHLFSICFILFLSVITLLWHSNIHIFPIFLFYPAHPICQTTLIYFQLPCDLFRRVHVFLPRKSDPWIPASIRSPSGPWMLSSTRPSLWWCSKLWSCNAGCLSSCPKTARLQKGKASTCKVMGDHGRPIVPNHPLFWRLHGYMMVEIWN